MSSIYGEDGARLERRSTLPEIMAEQINDLKAIDLPESPPSEEDEDVEAKGESKEGDAVEAQDEKEKDPFDVFWDGPDDPENPMNFSGKIKWPQTIIVAIFTFITPLASSMFAPGIEDVMKELHFSSINIGALTVSVYIVGYAVGPLFIAPASEYFGRLPIYHTTNFLYIIFTIACAVSPNVAALIVFRVLAGAVGSTPLVLGAGTIADLIPAEKRAVVMSFWTMGPLLGPVIGPVAGGFLVSAKGWRWVFWVITMAAGVATIVGFLVMRETYAPKILERKAARLRKETGDPRYKSRFQQEGSTKDIFLRAVTRPMKMLILSPITFILSLYMAVVYGYLYLLFTTITSIFISTYHFRTSLSGLAYLGIGVGLFIGLFIFGKTSAYMFAKHGKNHQPEHRLVSMVPGALCVPAGLFIYGWSAQYGVMWIVPEIGTALVGVGLILSFMPVGTYLIDAFTRYAASATAANTVLRSLFGAFLPLAGPSMYEKLGLGWGNSVLAFIALAFAVVPLLLLRYGKTIRTRYPVKL